MIDERTRDSLREMLSRRDALPMVRYVDHEATEVGGDLAPFGTKPPIRTLDVRRMRAPAPFTGDHYLVYEWNAAVSPEQPDVPLVHGESRLIDTGVRSWEVAMTRY